MNEEYPDLLPCQIERLALLQEELNEAGQAVCKILRHGFESCHPNGDVTNRRDLALELGDVMYALKLMLTCGDLGNLGLEDIWDAAEEKAYKVRKYLHHQDERITDLLAHVGQFTGKGLK